MSDIATTPPGGSEARTVTAFFDTGEHASAARADLIAAGIAGKRHHGRRQRRRPLSRSPADHHMGFWEIARPTSSCRTTTGVPMPRALRRVAAFAISVRASGMLYDKAIDVLDRDGAVDLDESES